MNIYEIKNTSFSAKINLSKGANCISLRNIKAGIPILREARDYEKPNHLFLYGMPILFPVNRIKAGRFVFENREYQFQINENLTGCHLHGNLNQCEFELISSGPDFAVCYYRPKAKEDFFGGIHEFEVMILYRLTDKGLEQRTTITNCSKCNMPLMIGFHTTFHVNNCTTSVCAGVTDHIERDEKQHLPTGKVLEKDSITEHLNKGTFMPAENGISRHYKVGNQRNMYIYDYENKYSICYANSANMGYRMIFNGEAKDYICLEPQNCMIDCLNGPFDLDYSGFEFLKPGESETYHSSILWRNHG